MMPRPEKHGEVTEKETPPTLHVVHVTSGRLYGRYYVLFLKAPYFVSQTPTASLQTR